MDYESLNLGDATSIVKSIAVQEWGAHVVILYIYDPLGVSQPYQLVFQDCRAVGWHVRWKVQASSMKKRMSMAWSQDVQTISGQQVLLMGAPGGGKTTILLHLARSLLQRAEQEEQQPMPVVFNLSSWAQEQQPLG